MAKLIITADLHFDPTGSLTPPAAVRDLAERMVNERPDAVVLAGDLGHPLASFRACLRACRSITAPWSAGWRSSRRTRPCARLWS